MQDYLTHIINQLGIHPELKYELKTKIWQTDFLRFYHSQTNYNISKSSEKLELTLYKGKKSNSFAIDDPDTTKLDRAFNAALEIIDQLPEDPDFVDVEDDLEKAPPRGIVNNIEAIPLSLKTEILTELAAATEPYGFEIYGTFVCNYSTYRIINSNNLDKESSISPIYLEVKAVHKDSQITVLETFGGDDFGLFELQDFKTRLLTKIGYCAFPVVDLEPGHYDVVLAPRCLGEFVGYLTYGMSARALDQHSSYFEGKIDQKVFPEHIEITDDPNEPGLIRHDYGSGGRRYRPLKLIEKGKFRNFMCNKYYHHKTGLPNNGNTGTCISIACGNKSLEEMIGGIKHGIYISSLHYMNFINPRETSLTGLTRDGTFLIKDGKICNVVVNLRFTERIERILNHVVDLENRSYTIPVSENYEIFDIEAFKAPHAVVTGFNITSSTNTI